MNLHQGTFYLKKSPSYDGHKPLLMHIDPDGRIVSATHIGYDLIRLVREHGVYPEREAVKLVNEILSRVGDIYVSVAAIKGHTMEMKLNE